MCIIICTDDDGVIPSKILQSLFNKFYTNPMYLLDMYLRIKIALHFIIHLFKYSIVGQWAYVIVLHNLLHNIHCDIYQCDNFILICDILFTIFLSAIFCLRYFHLEPSLDFCLSRELLFYSN